MGGERPSFGSTNRVFAEWLSDGQVGEGQSSEGLNPPWSPWMGLDRNSSESRDDHLGENRLGVSFESVTPPALSKLTNFGLPALLTSPAVVYITEIARKDMRGSLLALGPSFVSLGTPTSLVVLVLSGVLQVW
jgi:hypothetical protein